MAMDQVIKEALIRVDLETKKAEKELKSFTKQTDATAKSLDAVSTQALDVQRALETVGLGAEKQVSRLGKFNNGFQSLTGKLGQGIGGVSKFASALGPWNQALELGGKALRIADAGLEAYSKTSVRAAEEVKKLRDEFNGYKESVLSALGATTTFVAGTISSIDDLERRLLMSKLTGPASKLRFQSLFGGDDEAGGSRGAVSGIFGTIDQAKRALDELGGVAAWNGVGRGLDDAAAKFKEVSDKARQAALETARWKAEYAEQMSALRRTELRNNVKGGPGPQQDAVTEFLGSGRIGADNASQLGMLDVGLADYTELQSRGDRYAESASRRNDTFLEKTFGPLEDFNAYATAFQTLTGAVSAGLNAWIDGSMSAGQAIKKFLGEALKGLASQMAVESLKHTAYAIGSLAFGDARGAATHGAAAAAFGVAAAGAAAAARGLGHGGADYGAAPKTPTAGASSGSSNGQSNGRTTNYIIVGNDPANDESFRMRQRKAAKYVAFAEGRTSAGFSG